MATKEGIELLINFAGKLDLFSKLAKDNELILGFQPENPQDISEYGFFYEKLIEEKANMKDIWKVVVKNDLVQYLSNHSTLI